MTSTQNWVKTAISSWHRRFEKIVPIRDKAGAKLSTNCTGSTIWRSRHDSREFKQRRFLATHVNWKRTFCTLEPWFWTNGRLKLVLLSAPLGILATTTVMKRQKKNKTAKQQPCACITLFCTFLCHRCTTTKWNFLISRFSRTWTEDNNFLFFFWS